MSIKSQTINSIHFANLLSNLSKKMGFVAGSERNHWQFMRFIRRHKADISQKVGEPILIENFRKNNKSKFSKVATLKESHVVELLKTHKNTKDNSQEIVKRLLSMPGFAPLPQKIEKAVTETKHFKVGDYYSGIDVKKDKYAQVKKECLKIPKSKNGDNITFANLKDGQVFSGCLVMTTYKAHYDVIYMDTTEKKIYLSDLDDDLNLDDFDLIYQDEQGDFVLDFDLKFERIRMQFKPGTILRVDQVCPDDKKLVQCRAFCPGSQDAIILVHYSALVALNKEMRKEVVDIAKGTNLIEFCNVF